MLFIKKSTNIQTVKGNEFKTWNWKLNKKKKPEENIYNEKYKNSNRKLRGKSWKRVQEMKKESKSLTTR